MGYVASKIDRFGLLYEGQVSVERVYTPDVHTETSISPRQVQEIDEDPEGATIFSAFESTWELSAFDLDGVDQAETWMTAHSPVTGVAVLEDAFVIWDEPTPIVSKDTLTPGEAALVRGDYVMRRAVGDRTDHGVYLTRNALLPLAPENADGELAGGWADLDRRGVPDGYTEVDLTSTRFSSGVYEAYGDTAVAGGDLQVDLDFPVEGAEVTLSVDVLQLHDDGDTRVTLTTLDENGAFLTTERTRVTSTGRASVSITTDPGTHFLRVEPLDLNSVTAQNAKAQIKDPCLRVDGGTAYVPK